jgi:anthranilate phosphoribosyltransferase
MLKSLRRACVVHGSDGLDEITTAGHRSGRARAWRGALLRDRAGGCGLARVKPEALRGGDAGPMRSAQGVLEGIRARIAMSPCSTPRQLWWSLPGEDLADGVALAQHSIDSGAAEPASAA